ncbi:MAG: hypothetical protein ACYDCN_13670 [Bacteroidia bacterium]
MKIFRLLKASSENATHRTMMEVVIIKLIIVKIKKAAYAAFH